MPRDASLGDVKNGLPSPPAPPEASKTGSSSGSVMSRYSGGVWSNDGVCGIHRFSRRKRSSASVYSSSLTSPFVEGCARNHLCHRFFFFSASDSPKSSSSLSILSSSPSLFSSRTIVPTGTWTIKSSPFRPCLNAPPPEPPAPPIRRFRTVASDASSGEVVMYTEPPCAPLPPEGDDGPRREASSAAAPFPPLPPRTVTIALSTNDAPCGALTG